MSAIPSRRLFVYIATGLVVLAVGTVGLWSMRGGSQPGEGVIIEANGTAVSLGADGVAGAADGVIPGEGSSEVVGSSATITSLVPRIWVQVAGAVRRPGVYEVEAGARAFEAVLAAGGFTDEADQQAVALAAKLSDGCRVYVPKAGESAVTQVEVPVTSVAGITGAGDAGGGGSAVSGGQVSLNSAGVEELDTLPGVGPALARQIVAYREANGPFTSIDQLDEVPGIGQAKLEQLRPLVTL
jgi:competence protein ComEA